MKPRLPLKIGRRYRTNDGDEITIVKHPHASPDQWLRDKGGLALNWRPNKLTAPATTTKIVEELTDDATLVREEHEEMMAKLTKLYGSAEHPEEDNHE